MSVPVSPLPGASQYSRLSATPGGANNIVGFQRQPQPSLTTVRPGDIPELSRYFDPKTLPGALPKNPVPVLPLPSFDKPSESPAQPSSTQRSKDFSDVRYRLSFDYNETQWWNGVTKTVTNVSEHWGPVGGLAFGNSYRGYIESIDVLSAGLYPWDEPGEVKFRWLIADWEPNKIFNIHNVKLEKIYPNGFVEPDTFEPSESPPKSVPDAPPNLPPPITPDQYPEHEIVPFRRVKPAPNPTPPPETKPEPPEDDPIPVVIPSSVPPLVPEHSPNPSPAPSPEPDPSPAPSPEPSPSPTPSPEPDPSPTPSPEPDPSPNPSPEPSPSPTPSPSPEPSPSPDTQSSGGNKPPNIPSFPPIAPASPQPKKESHNPCENSDSCSISTNKTTKDNNQKLSELNALLQGIDLALLKSMDAKLNVINTKLGPQISGGGISGLLTKFWSRFLKFTKWLQLDRILIVLTWMNTLHNAAALSSNLSHTLFNH